MHHKNNKKPKNVNSEYLINPNKLLINSLYLKPNQMSMLLNTKTALQKQNRVILDLKNKITKL